MVHEEKNDSFLQIMSLCFHLSRHIKSIIIMSMWSYYDLEFYCHSNKFSENSSAPTAAS